MGERVELTEEHRHLVRQALEQIEDAQGLVLLAAENLSTVSGLADDWQATVELYESIKAHWHRVEERLAGLTGTF